MEKKSIEDLSNLVFGLALGLGAITLVAPSRDSYVELAGILLRFALSFFIIFAVWWLYNAHVTELDLGKGNRFLLNVLLLLLVVIEPFLLTIAHMKSGATAYALDLGTIMVIMAVFNYLILQDERERLDRARAKELRSRMLTLTACSILFFLSIVPVIIFPKPDGENISSLIWLGVLLFFLTRYISRKK